MSHMDSLSDAEIAQRLANWATTTADGSPWNALGWTEEQYRTWTVTGEKPTIGNAQPYLRTFRAEVNIVLYGRAINENAFRNVVITELDEVAESGAYTSMVINGVGISEAEEGAI